jgi:hypothetical protein
MSYSVNNIIQVTTRFVPGALGFANFGFAVLIITETEGVAAGLAIDEYRDYANTADMLTDGFTSVDESYKAADKWLGATPNVRQLRVYVKPDADASYVDTYARARDSFWWYITLNTIDLYDNPADVILAATWCNSNEAYFANCAFDAQTIVPGDMTSVSYDLTQLGLRRVHSTYNPDDRYAAFPILSWFATVNYQLTNSTITGEYKTITNSPAVTLTTTEQNALLDVQVKTGFVSDVDLQGQTVKNRYINSITHSANFEFIDDVFNSDAFVNAIKVDALNAVANPTTKLGQTLAGQQLILNTVKNTCERYLDNGYLGERNYLNPDNGLEEFTRGYEILTVAEDILDLTASERTNRFSAPIRLRVFRAGAIHKSIIDITIM